MDAQNGVVFPWQVYLFACVGIAISVVLPILRKMLPTTPAPFAVSSIKPYIVIGAFSLLTAVLIVAFGGAEAQRWTWYSAVLAGYAWDSTLQKISGK